jgi:hypothetical protein
VIVEPAVAVAGPVLVIARSADGVVFGLVTGVVAVDVLFAEFESGVVDVTDAVLAIDAAVADTGTFSTIWNTATAPDGNVAIVHVVVPDVPGVGFVHANVGPEL